MTGLLFADVTGSQADLLIPQIGKKSSGAMKKTEKFYEISAMQLAAECIAEISELTF